MEGEEEGSTRLQVAGTHRVTRTRCRRGREWEMEKVAGSYKKREIVTVLTLVPRQSLVLGLLVVD